MTITPDKTTPNFFILLGLNPDERWDPAKFEQVLREKRIEWSRQGSGVAKKALAAKKNLELLPQIRRVMEDPTLREAQAVAARAERSSERKAALEHFEKEVAYLNAKEYIEQTELEAFLNAYKQLLPEHEIRRRITVRVGTPDFDTQQQAQQLETSIYKDITDKLQTLHLFTLYELLGRPETTSNEELCRAAEQLYDDMVRRQPKTAEVTAKTDLAGHAKAIFTSRQMRERYNESMLQSSLNVLLKELDEIVSRTAEKELYEGQIVIFLQAAREAGWKDERALARLKEYARQHKWVLRTLPTIDISTQQQRCGYCQEMNEKNRNFCRNCNEPLVLHCPDCGHKASSDEIWCGVCGFPVGNRYWVDDLLKRAIAVQDHDLKQAEALLQEAENAWKPHKPDERVQRIKEQKEAIQQRVQAQQHSIEQLNQLIRQRQLYEARNYLNTHPEVAAKTESLVHIVERDIAQAQALIQQAQVPTMSQQKRVELCRRALRLCADYQEARDLLSATPPTPPGNLQANVGKAMVNLTWQPSSTPFVKYRILRKRHSQPVSARDGVLLDTSAGLSYDDTTPEVGVPLYYAVFTDCEGVISLQGATLHTPVLLPLDITVENLTCLPTRTALHLQWRWPAQCQGVIVAYRYDGWPQLDESPEETAEKVTRATYDLLGHFPLRGSQDRDYYITVCALVKQGNEQFLGPPTSIRVRLASKMVLRYEIKQTGFVRKKRVLHLSTDKPGRLPSLLLVSRRDRLPLRKTEGEVVFAVDGPLPIENELVLALPEQAFPPNTFGKLYLADDRAYETVNIYHPSEEKLRLS